jgi:hypothetical protein
MYKRAHEQCLARQPQGHEEEEEEEEEEEDQAESRLVTMGECGAVLSELRSGVGCTGVGNCSMITRGGTAPP